MIWPSRRGASAHDIEAAVVQRLKQMLQERRTIALLLDPTIKAEQFNAALIAGRTFARQLGKAVRIRRFVSALIMRVHLGGNHIVIELLAAKLLQLLAIYASKRGQPSTITIAAQGAKIRRGKDTRLIIADNDGRSDGMRDDLIVSFLGEARAAYYTALASPDNTIKERAAETKRCRKRVGQLLRIAMLVPDIVESCVDGTQPIRLTAKTFLMAELPTSGAAHRRMLGFR